MDAVHDVVSKWEKTLNDDKNQPFHGVNHPDLADLVSVFTVAFYEIMS